MGILAFLGLGAAVILFLAIIFISLNGVYTNCVCELVIFYKDAYIFANLGLAIFFLLFSTLMLTKYLELRALKNKASEATKENNDTALTTVDYYTIYQLPLVQLFSKISFFCSLAIFALAVAVIYFPYSSVDNCDPSVCYIYIYDSESFILCYGSTGLFFSLFSLLVARNIAKYKQSTH